MSETYKHVWGDLARQYNFAGLLKTLVDGDEPSRLALIEKNPISLSYAFDVYCIDTLDEVKKQYAKAIEERHAGKDNKAELRECQHQLQEIKVIQKLTAHVSVANYMKEHPPARPAPQPAPAPARVGPRWHLCGVCGGVGRTRCSSCGGTGTHPRSASRTRYDGSIEYYTEQVPCYSCSGGRITCSRCGGSGQVLE